MALITNTQLSNQQIYNLCMVLLGIYAIFITDGFKVIRENMLLPHIPTYIMILIELACFGWKIIILHKLVMEVANAEVNKKEKKVTINSQLETHIYDSTQNLASQDRQE